jgi:hypothetical protein
VRTVRPSFPLYSYNKVQDTRESAKDIKFLKEATKNVTDFLFVTHCMSGKASPFGGTHGRQTEVSLLSSSEVFRLAFYFISFLWWGENESTSYVGHSLAYCTSRGLQIVNVEQ